MKLSTLSQTLVFKSLAKIKKTLLFAFLFLLASFQGNSQNSITFNYTGAPQFWTVPPCVDSVLITVAGAKGGGMTSNLNFGAIITYAIPVTAGQTYQINVGGAGVGTVGGWNGGGNGQISTTVNPSSGGGGGASDMRVAPYGLADRFIVAGGGGGTNGSTSGNVASGGAGGCPNGVIGQGSPFTIVGGGGGTQTAGGIGGPPWGGGGQTGNPGTLGQGGDGGIDLLYGTPGGGGGGGYYGGGGGGTDGCCPGSNGGGAGGGGSSLMPVGAACLGANASANGYITISTPITISNTGPYCVGDTIQFISSDTTLTSYSWTGPNGFTSTDHSPFIPNGTMADTGVYQLTTTLPSGCLSNLTTTVVVVPALQPNAGIDDTICFGTSFPLAGTVTVPDDASTWTYYAPGVSPTPTVTYLPSADSLNTTVGVTVPGTYNFILTETNPVCGSATDTLVLFVKQMDVQTMFTDPTCNGGSDGTISVSGTDAVEFSYDIGVTWVTTPATGLTAGTYTVCARDINQCQACIPVTLTDPPMVQISLSNDTLICENGTSTLVASATNGTGFTYNWTQFPTTADTQYGSPAVDTYYSVEAVSSDGCVSAMDSVYVTVRPAITGTISMNDTICPGYNTMLSASAQDGIGAPYTFTWSDGTVGIGPSHSFMVSPASTQNYTVTITDACESTPVVLTNEIFVSPTPVPIFTVDAPEKCEPAEFVLNVTTNPADYVSASWLLSDGQFYTNQDTVWTNPMMEGAYNVQMVLVNQFGCIDSVTYNSYLVSHPLPIAKFKFYPNSPSMFSTTVQFTNFSVHESNSYWTFQDGDPAGSIDTDAETMFPEGEIGFYDVQLIVETDFGCLDTTMQTVEVKPEVIIYAPNSFTPDGDEFNGNWGVHIVGIDVQEYKLEIRNRWGEVLWVSNDPEATWDGTYNNTLVPQGMYNWFIRAKDAITDEPYLFKGHINLFR